MRRIDRNIFSVRLLFIIVFLSAILLEASKCEGTLKERTDAAKGIFSGNEKLVSQYAASFIRTHHSAQYALTSDSVLIHCNCITDTFAVQLAKEYDLVSLREMKNEPQKCLEVVIDRLLLKNDSGVMHCLGAGE